MIQLPQQTRLATRAASFARASYLPAHEVEEKVAAEYANVKVRQLGPKATKAEWALHLGRTNPKYPGHLREP